MLKPLSSLGSTSEKGKHVIRRWHFSRFEDDKVMLSYQNTKGECIERKIEVGHEGT